MYKVTCKHYHPIYRNGDRESDWEILKVSIFSTQKAVKEYFKSSKQKINFKEKISCLSVKGDKTWFNEGTGEIDHEIFLYQIEKV